MKYHRQLTEAILWGRMDYLSEVTNIEVITLEQAPEAYQLFDKGSPKKFVIDPHGSLKQAAQCRRTSRIPGGICGPL
jgi:glutathione-independent formaldehyde dehydrogenase